MDEDTKQINYLPEELRKEEEKELARKQGQQAPSVPQFHLPQKTAVDQEKPRPLIVPAPAQEAKKTETPFMLEEEPVKPKPKLSFGKFFKFKKRSEEPVATEQKKEAELQTLPGQAAVENQLSDSPKLIRRSQAGESIDVNLIPEGTYLLSNKRIVGIIFQMAALAVVVLIIAYAALIFYGSSLKDQEKSLDTQLAQKESELKNYQGAETAAVIRQTKLETLGGLLSGHIYWTKFFRDLEVLTIPEVYYQTIIANANGTVSLAANATDYTAVSRQFIVLQQAADVFKNVEIGSLSGNAETGSVGFNILLELQDNLFNQDSL